MDINNLAAAKIKDIRKKLGYTAEAAAQDLGISKTAYSQLENGHVEITLTKLDTLSKAWSIPLADLVPGINGNHQISNGSGDNFNSFNSSTKNTNNNFFHGKDDANTHIIETLTQLINDLKKEPEQEG